MNYSKISLLVVSAFIVAFTATRKMNSINLEDRRNIVSAKVNDTEVIGCGLPATPIAPFGVDRAIVPLPGWGTHSWKISSANDSAQFYFNQGLNLFYSFHMEESRSSFDEALVHDPGCAMAHWGKAMASGPNINSPGYDFNDAGIISGLEKAVSVARDSLEKKLISAQQLRYSKNESSDRISMAIAYRDALKTILDEYPENIEVSVLYADAMMQVNARDWYFINKKPKTGTLEIVEQLENIIEKSPDHPAALHYYVHMAEASDEPEKAIDEADKLMGLLPSVAHMVHMPSHIYIRTGNYQKGVLSNKLAIAGYRNYQKVLNGWEGSRTLYFYHNADMQGTNAMMMGNYVEAKQSFQQNIDKFNLADTALFSSPGFGSYFQFLMMQPYLLDVRFGNWKKLQQAKRSLSRGVYASALWNFGQGMAYANTSKLANARKYLGHIKASMKDSALYKRRGNRNRGIDGVTIAVNILEGTIAMRQHQYNDAIKFFSDAVQVEDSLRYSEPEDWRIPARHYLGQAYIAKGEYPNALKTFEADLKDQPLNFWALNGIREVLVKQHKTKELAAHLARYETVLAMADARVPGSAF
ncbi:MAG TPA: hypothetical protein VEZ17_07855 [Chitinophagaceae bacterium]|nr:hypothetical protein [Chitinophagaceae bacterium]